MKLLSIKVKINKPVPPHKAGQVVTVFTDEFGTPIKGFWRERFADAVVDNCIEEIKPELAPKPKPKTKTNNAYPAEDLT